MSGLAGLVDRIRAHWRALCGEDAYSRYLRHAALEHPERAPMSRKEFFKAEQARRWNGVRRCC